MHIGIDIGGSAVQMSAVQLDGTVVARRTRKFHAGESFEGLFADIVTACRSLEDEAGYPAGAIGVCSRGFIEANTGMLADGGFNVQTLRGRPLAQLMSAEFGIPIHFANDGVAAAVGEI